MNKKDRIIKEQRTEIERLKENIRILMGLARRQHESIKSVLDSDGEELILHCVGPEHW